MPFDGIHGHGKHLEAPGEGQQAGSDTEGNYVGQRIEFFAEIAGGFGHPRNAAIDRVKGDGEADGHGGVVEMLRLLHRSLQALHNGKVAGGDIARGEERGNDIHASAQAPSPFDGERSEGIALHAKLSCKTSSEGSPCSGWMSARTDAPPLTRCPRATRTCA